MAGPIVIIGAGQAGAKAAETLRRLGFDGAITVVGSEALPPYQRPPLSKKFLSGDMQEAQLWLHGPAFHDQQRIELLTGTHVAAIDRHARTVRMEDGRRLPFWKLLIATGSRPRRLDIAGGDLTGVHVLRDVGHVADLRASVETSQRIVIVGGGYIGLEVAASLRRLGREVVVLEAQDRLLQRVVSPAVSRFFHDLHVAHGVEVHTGVRIVRLLGETRVRGVELASGTIAADAVLVAVGSEANDQLAAAAGLPTQAGIIVDAHCRVDGDIFAAGDCARFHSRRYGCSVRLESVQNAIDQAKAAAAAMLGQPQDYDPVPWFWSDQYDVKLQIAGLSGGHDRVEMAGNPDERAFSVSYYRGDRLLAVDAINAPRAHMQARRQLAEAPPDRGQPDTPGAAGAGP